MIKIAMPSYDILIESGIFEQLNRIIKEIHQEKNIFVITDDHVLSIYQSKLNDVLQGFPYEVISIKPGESSKSIETYQTVINQLIGYKIKRDDILIAFGGGVVGDLTGFIASTLYRGLRYIQVPTTLLAMVDSSIGGKTGINLESGKNLLGTFYQPSVVLIDPDFLETLADLEYQNGVAEMIKAGLIGDSELYTQLKQSDKVTMRDIYQAILVKQAVVLKDPFDHNERMFLNFGHTFGHAIETKHNYDTYKHGVAISYGMLMALKLGQKRGITPKELYDDLLEVLLNKGLVKLPLLDHKDYVPYLFKDKKNTSTGLNFIVIKTIGTPLIITLKPEEL